MRRGKNAFARGLALSLCAFALLVAGTLRLLNGMDAQSAQTQEELVAQALRRAMITCYAVEGAYPADVDYLKKNYGLAYNEDEYFVYYNAFADNIMPEIHVNRRGNGT